MGKIVQRFKITTLMGTFINGVKTRVRGSQFCYIKDEGLSTGWLSHCHMVWLSPYILLRLTTSSLQLGELGPASRIQFNLACLWVFQLECWHSQVSRFPNSHSIQVGIRARGHKLGINRSSIWAIWPIASGFVYIFWSLEDFQAWAFRRPISK